MKALNSLSNHVSGLPAKTVQTSAHGLGLVMAGFGERDIASKHSKSLFSYPLSLSTSRSNPHSGFASSMNNSESPLCLKFKHILVGNQLGAKRVYNLYGMIPENKFGFDPDCIGYSDQDKTNQQFKGDLKGVGIYRKTVSGKKTHHCNRNAGPNKITSGTKSFIHKPIIAGETQ